MSNEPYEKLYKMGVEKHLRNGFNKMKDLNHELERQGGQCCLGGAALPHSPSLQAHDILLPSY
jgi:hypothetical protein